MAPVRRRGGLGESRPGDDHSPSATPPILTDLFSLWDFAKLGFALLLDMVAVAVGAGLCSSVRRPMVSESVDESKSQACMLQPNGYANRQQLTGFQGAERRSG